MLSLFIKRMSICEAEGESNYITNFYLERKKYEYIGEQSWGIIEKIGKRVKKDSFTYSFWGMNQIAEIVEKNISDFYPKATLINIYDSFKKIEFLGKASVSPCFIKNGEEDYVIVSSIGCVNAAKEMIKEYGLDENRFIFWENVL